MNILLINTNPVVSRLLALCTRDEHMVLDEVKSVEAVEKSGYDIVFVDETAYTDNVASLFDGLGIRKKVFLSYSEIARKGFDVTVKKPFLPSQIIKILAETEASQAVEDVKTENVAKNSIEDKKDMENALSAFPSDTNVSPKEETVPVPSSLSDEEETAEQEKESQGISDSNVLNMDDIAKIKALLDMEEDEAELPEDALLEDDAYEARKIQVIKEQLIADGVEILEEDEIVEALSTSVEKASEKLNKKLKKIKKRHKKKTHLDEEECIALEAALGKAIANLKPKKIKKLLKGEEIKVKIKLEDHS